MQPPRYGVMSIKEGNHPNLLKASTRLIPMLGLAIALLLASPVSVGAGPDMQPPPTPELQGGVAMTNDECLACHKTPDMLLPLESGEQLYLTVNQVEYDASVHGREGYLCIQCHTNITSYPHPDLTIETVREFQVAAAEICGNCHTHEKEKYLEGDHAKLLAEGNLNAAVCTDCHGSHQIQEFGGSRSRIVETCRRCHSEIYDVYKGSVHGNALLEESDPSVPTCVDCHSNHSNAGPEERPEFHLFSVEICAQCHADRELMSRYGVNTEVFDTYVADFHGTTVTIFEKIAPDQQTNKPVCIDCHGVHDIRPPDDELSSVMKSNLITTCRRCHPEASIEFPDAWLSHYPPDMEHNTIVYAVDLFYKFLIPATVAGLLVFILSDLWRRYTHPRPPRLGGDQQ
jgi:nitrate/TMAO reductase-like tetraheme cytochrome c subunit